ncbi:diacylglycerol acyltransferase-domain-containing protein [Lipomyces japonicus]|uniref:diacylglycerol acyltransferase-domain-containing protein n=1 Tax=Lipomyces japonicus TaxID=56871 RepID=UPI0034CEE7B8
MTESINGDKAPRRPSHKGIRFAPLKIPLGRRLQTLAVLFHSIALPYCVGLFFLLIAFPPFWPLLIAYVIFAYWVDKSFSNGQIANRRSPFFRRLPLFRLFCDYFPIRLHREIELEPTFPNRLREPSGYVELWLAHLFGMQDAVVVNESESDNDDASIKMDDVTQKESKLGPRYVFGYHPHGIVSLGAFGGIGTEGAGWEKLFPGIPVSLLTLESNFSLPFYREYILPLGVASVSRKSCTALLEHNQSICIVIGGAQESLLASPSSMDLIIKKRLGFVKLAMSAPPNGSAGTCLVPILSFGENDAYDQVRSDHTSLLYRIQTLIKRHVGFTLPLMHARGIFNYDFGLMPYRRPINIVVGTAIKVPYVATPTEAEVKKYHLIYMKELQRLWDTHKDKYVTDWTGKGLDSINLKFVE